MREKKITFDSNKINYNSKNKTEYFNHLLTLKKQYIYPIIDSIFNYKYNLYKLLIIYQFFLIGSMVFRDFRDVIVAIMSTIFFLSLGIYITVHAGPLSQSHFCSPLHSPLSTSHRCHQTLKAIFPVIVASTETFSLHVHIKLFGGAG